MHRLKLIVFSFCLAVASAPATAALKAFACEPEWAALIAELAGERIVVFSATTAQQDPHRIEARPSLIARLRQADLLVCTGAELEIGWLPVLLRQAGNARVQPGQAGYFEAAAIVDRIDIPTAVDRSLGDIHASGNPHVHTDPRRITVIADKLAERLARIDPAHADRYRARHTSFAQRWRRTIADWSARGARLRGTRVVAHHRDWIYLYDWLGLIDAGTLEARPGIPPSAAHLADLKAKLERAPARLVIRTPYQDARAADWLSHQVNIPAVVLPYTVGGSERARDLFSLFDDTLARLLEHTQ